MLLPRLVFMSGGPFTPRTRAFLAHISNRIAEKPFSSKALREIIDALAA